jgi:hypothetical protein
MSTQAWLFCIGVPIAWLYQPVNTVCARETVEGMVNRFLAETLHVQRFETPHVMRYRSEFEVVNGNRSIPPVEATHYVDQPKYRAIGKLGPLNSDGSGWEVHNHVWNGRSEANLYQHTASEDDHLTISRGEVSTDIPKSNKYLALLGVPRTDFEREEDKRGLYWFPGGVRGNLGYSIEPEVRILDGIPCTIVKGDGDTLWFDLRNSCRLVLRDAWRKQGSIYREVSRYHNYGAHGLPSAITVTRYNIVDVIGKESPVWYVERLKLLELSFRKPPADVFTLSIKKGTQVLDIGSLTTFVAQGQNDRPFDKVLSTTPIRFRAPRTPRIFLPLLICTLNFFIIWYGFVLLSRMKRAKEKR